MPVLSKLPLISLIFIIVNCGYYFRKNKELVSEENDVNKMQVKFENLNLSTEHLEIGLFNIVMTAKFGKSVKSFKLLELSFKEIDDKYERKMNQIDGEFTNGEWRLQMNDVNLPFSEMDMKFKYEICTNSGCNQKNEKIRINNSEKLKLENRIWNALMSV